MIINKAKNKVEKVKKILGDGTHVVMYDDVVLLNGDVIEILIMIQKTLMNMIESGVPKEMAKDLIEVAFMDKEQLDKKLEEELKRFKKNMEDLSKKLEKTAKKKKENTNENSNKQK